MITVNDPGRRMAVLQAGDRWDYDVEGNATREGRTMGLRGQVRVTIERRQAGPEFARCRRSSRTPARRETRGRIGKGCSRQVSQAHPRRLSATVANRWSQWAPSHRADIAWPWQRHLLGNSGRRKT